MEEEEYNSIKVITNTAIPRPLGSTVKVGDVMDVKEGKTSDTIERRKGKMYASLTADVKSKDAAAISTEIENKISEQDLPNGVKVEFGIYVCRTTIATTTTMNEKPKYNYRYKKWATRNIFWLTL